MIRFNRLGELTPLFESLYSSLSSYEQLTDLTKLHEYRDLVNRLMDCKPIVEYWGHIKPEDWTDMGLEDMATLKGLSEEIVKAFVDDARKYVSPQIPLSYLIEFFDNKTVTYNIKIIFLTDNLPAEIDEPLELDDQTFLTIENNDHEVPLYYILRKRMPVKFCSFRRLKEAERELRRKLDIEVSKLLTSLILLGCTWVAIKEIRYDPPYPFWPHESVRESGNLPDWETITIPAKVTLKRMKSTHKTEEDKFLESLEVEIVKDEQLLWRLEHGVLAPDLKYVGAGSIENWIKFKNIWVNISELPYDFLNNLIIASRRYFYVLNKRDPEDQMIDFCIFLESLLTKSSEKMELADRLSRRAGLLLSHDDGSWRENTKLFKDIYSLRSKIVHGKRIDLNRFSIVLQLEKYMITIMKKILLMALYWKEEPLRSIDEVIDEIDEAMFLTELRERIRRLSL